MIMYLNIRQHMQAIRDHLYAFHDAKMSRHKLADIQSFFVDG